MTPIRALAVVGATYVLTQGRVARPIRKLGDHMSASLARFLRCPMCVGFWMGAAFGIDNLTALAPIDRLEAGFTGSLLSWTAFILLDKLGAGTHLLPDDKDDDADAAGGMKKK